MKQRAQQAAQAFADHCTLCSISCVSLSVVKFRAPYHLGVITVDEARDLDGQHQLLVDGRVSRYL